MSPPVFLVEPGGLVADEVTLDGPEGRHAARVRRIAAGERVDLVDGVGTRAECLVVEARRDTLLLRVRSRAVEPEPSPRLVVVQALAKGDRAEQAVEAMTEVGVDVVIPWAAARSVVQWRGERGEKALARWRATAREAAKQSRRARVPEVRPCASTGEVTRLLADAALPLVLHEEATTPITGHEVPPSGDLVLVVGPEGGIAPDEVAAFTAVGGVPTRLGSTVLRASTAGVVAASVLLARSGRWS